MNMIIPWFDILLIVVLTIALAVLDHFDLLSKYAHFAIIPILAFYYLGVWVGKKRR